MPEAKAEPIINVPEQFGLTQIECLEVKNINIQRQLLQSEMEKLMLEEQLWSNKVSQRVGLNVMNYTVDPSRGICVIRPEVKQQLIEQMQPKTPAEPPKVD